MDRYARNRVRDSLRCQLRLPFPADVDDPELEGLLERVESIPPTSREPPGDVVERLTDGAGFGSEWFIMSLPAGDWERILSAIKAHMNHLESGIVRWLCRRAQREVEGRLIEKAVLPIL